MRELIMGKKYVIITPARNEEAFLEETIRSVIAQTILPHRWVIVSDNSTDQTGDIADRYARSHDFMRLVRVNHGRRRDFSSKVHAFNAGYEALDCDEYSFIANLDADVTLVPNYYERLLSEFDRSRRVGVAGGIILEKKGDIYRERFSNRFNISGAIQMFARSCYEEVGGYIPLKYGGEDTVSQYLARMRGWDVIAVPELEVIHHRTRKDGLAFSFILGAEDYACGSHPFFELMRCCYRMLEKPYIISGMCRMCGYLWASIKREPRVPNEALEYIQWEQMQRLLATAKGNQLDSPLPVTERKYFRR